MTTHASAIAFAGAGAVAFEGVGVVVRGTGAVLPSAEVVAVVIASGQSLSGAARIGAGQLAAIDLPTLTDAGLTFQASVDGSTYREALDSAGVAATLDAGTGGQMRQAPAALLGAPYLKVRSGTSGSPVSQGADRTITLVVR